MRRCAWIVLLSLFVLRAQAQGSLPLELEWEAPRECPSAAEVRLELERIARARPGTVLSPLWARAVVTLRGRSYHTVLQTAQSGQRGERELEAADCATLLRTVTLVLALTFGAGAELTEDAAAMHQAVAPAPAVAELSDRTADTSEQDRSGHEHEPTSRAWSLLAGVGTQLGLLPTAALLVSTGALLDGPAWSLDVRARGSFAREKSLPEDVDAHFRALGAALTACWRRPFSTFTASLCGAAQAASLRGTTTGATSGSAHAPWYALSGMAGLTWPHASRLRLRVEAGLAAALNRPRFVVQGLGQVYQAHQVHPVQPELSLLLVFSP